MTKRTNELRQTPGATLWQRNYWEHIIRNEIELNHLREYIRNNPAQWELDRLYVAEGAGATVGARRAVPLPFCLLV